MSVKAKHTEYNQMQDRWQRCRDVVCGQDAVHRAGVTYLPKLKDQTNEDYQGYVKRTPFYNATGRTVEGLLGMLFRKPPKVEAPERVLAMLKDVTLSGVPFELFIRNVARDAVGLGRAGILVDYPRVADIQNKTLADAKILNLRPTMQMYKAEDIINWKTTTINNQIMVSMVVLKEMATIAKDEFEETTDERFRVLDLTPIAGFGMAYRVRLYRIDEKGNDVLLEQYLPLMNNRPLNYVPFVFIGTENNLPCVTEPPLMDLVDLNLSHYRTSADYEHGCHFTGLPTPVITGHRPEIRPEGEEPEKYYIGSMSAWVFPSPDAKATYLEFQGQGLQVLEKNLDRKESQMAILGARMLAPEKKQAEAAETAAIHRGGETSIMANIAQTMSLGIERAMQIFTDWAGMSATVTFAINRDFHPFPITPEMLRELVAGWQSGAYSYETLFENLKRGEIFDTDDTAEDEQSKVANQPPLLTGAPNPGASGLPQDKPTDTGDE